MGSSHGAAAGGLPIFWRFRCRFRQCSVCSLVVAVGVVALVAGCGQQAPQGGGMGGFPPAEVSVVTLAPAQFPVTFEIRRTDRRIQGCGSASPRHGHRREEAVPGGGAGEGGAAALPARSEALRGSTRIRGGRTSEGAGARRRPIARRQPNRSPSAGRSGRRKPRRGHCGRPCRGRRQGGGGQGH